MDKMQKMTPAKIESLLEEEMTSILGGKDDIVCQCTSGAQAIKSNELADD